MPAAQFDYIAPTTVDEAVAALVKGGRDTRVMAGGTDLIVKIRHRMLFPKCIVNLKRIAGLDAITVDKTNGLTIGATALLADVAAHKGIRRHYPTVAEAAGATANVQVRNMGTVVGNLCNASPSADNAPTLMAMAATVDIAGPTGSRSMPLDQFFQGPGITALEDRRNRHRRPRPSSRCRIGHGLPQPLPAGKTGLFRGGCGDHGRFE